MHGLAATSDMAAVAMKGGTRVSGLGDAAAWNKAAQTLTVYRDGVLVVLLLTGSGTSSAPRDAAISLAKAIDWAALAVSI